MKILAVHPVLRQWSSRHKHDIINLLALATVWLMMVAIANPLGDFPLNDDWVYALAVKSLLETGSFNFPSPAGANVGPQVYWGALFCIPYGFSFTALRFSTLVLGLIGVMALYLLVMELVGKRRIALLSALVLAVNPLYFGLANTFMTDVPFVSMVIIALYFIQRGLQRPSSFDLALGFVFTFTAILIRQLGLATLVGFAVAYPIKNGFKFNNIAKAVTPLVLGILMHFTYQYWLVNTGRTLLLSTVSTIENFVPISFNVWTHLLTGKFVIAITYVGFFVLPFITAIPMHKPTGIVGDWWKSIQIVLVAFATSFIGLLWWMGRMMPSSGNILIKSGLGPLTLRDTYLLKVNNPLITTSIDIFWMVVTILSVLAACSVIYFLIIATRLVILTLINAESFTNIWPLMLYAATGTAYFTALVIVPFGNFDRYYLLLLPLTIVLFSSVKFEHQLPINRVTIGFSFVLIAAYLVFSVAATHDYLSWNRSRWTALHNLIDDGKVNPKKIDGGYEFNGWFLHDVNYVRKPDKSYWWVDDDEYIITSGPLPRYTEVLHIDFNRWLLLSKSNIFILRRFSK